MSLFCCPLCRAPLERNGASLRCPGGHSFDFAKEGYIHLLLPNRKHSALPGDDREMVRARRDFLSNGSYQPLLHTLCREMLARLEPEPVLLDAGCGEGYYTAGVHQALSAAGRNPRTAGTDISKFALRWAAKREPAAEFAVASSYRLPLGDGTADALLNCFSPLALEEFRRVLKPGGWFFYVVPGPRHLWALKEILYDSPYPNEEKETPYEGFAYRAIVPADGRILLETPADIENLFRMTPYFWKTPQAGGERLRALPSLETEISFRIHIFQKEN